MILDHLRRRYMLWRMHRKIDRNMRLYTDPRMEAVAVARHQLARMVRERRDSPEIVQFRAKRAAALKGTRG